MLTKPQFHNKRKEILSHSFSSDRLSRVSNRFQDDVPQTPKPKDPEPDSRISKSKGKQVVADSQTSIPYRQNDGTFFMGREIKENKFELK
jgi:hypothetical protein